MKRFFLVVSAAVLTAIVGVSYASPTVLGDLFRLTNKAFASFPAAASTNIGALIYDSTNNVVRYSNGTAWGQLGAVTTWDLADALVDRQMVSYQIRDLTGGSTILVGTGGVDPTVSSTGSVAIYTFLGGRGWLKTTSNAVDGNIAGLNNTSTTGAIVRGEVRPRIRGLIRTDASIATARIYFGATNTTTPPTVDIGAGTTDPLIAIKYSSTVPDTEWQCCSGDGTDASCTTTGVAVAVDTTYDMALDWSVAGTLTCTVNGTSVNKTSNLDATGTTVLYPRAVIACETCATSRIINVGPYIADRL